MAMTVTAYGSDVRTISTYPQWFVWDVAGELLEGTTPDTEEIALITCPIGTILIDATVCCIKAAAATGTDKCSVQIALDGGTVDAFTATADNGGAADVLDRAVDLVGSLFPVEEAVNITVLREISADTGSDTTGGAHYRVGLLLFRAERPTDTTDN